MLNEKNRLSRYGSIAGLSLVLGGALLTQSVGPGVAVAHADTVATSSPLISSLASVPTTTAATITWTTDQPANSQVTYGTTTSYGASTTLDSNLVTLHSETLLGLVPSTAYHYMVTSAGASSTAATSSDQTFTTTALPVVAPVISAITSVPTTTSATITWTTDQPASSQVNYGTTTSYGASTTVDTSLVTAHSQTLLGLMPDTVYHFALTSVDVSGTATSSDLSFTTTDLPVVGTTTATTTPSGYPTFSDIQVLQDQITQLQNQINALNQRLQSFFGDNTQGSQGGWHCPGHNNGSHGGSTGTTTPGTGDNGGSNGINGGGTTGGSTGTTTLAAPQASIDPVSPVRAGTSVDFGGRNFGSEEAVTVTAHGALVTTAHADGGGNFSTGSLPVSNTVGAVTYTFTGQTSGIVRTVVLTITA